MTVIDPDSYRNHLSIDYWLWKGRDWTFEMISGSSENHLNVNKTKNKSGIRSLIVANITNRHFSIVIFSTPNPSLDITFGNMKQTNSGMLFVKEGAGKLSVLCKMQLLNPVMKVILKSNLSNLNTILWPSLKHTSLVQFKS